MFNESHHYLSLYIYLSLPLSLSLSLPLSLSISLYLSFYLYRYVCISLSLSPYVVSPYIYLSIYLSISLSLSVSLALSLSISLYLSLNLFISLCMSISLCTYTYLATFPASEWRCCFVSLVTHQRIAWTARMCAQLMATSGKCTCLRLGNDTTTGLLVWLRSRANYIDKVRRQTRQRKVTGFRTTSRV